MFLKGTLRQNNDYKYQLEPSTNNSYVLGYSGIQGLTNTQILDTKSTRFRYRKRNPDTDTIVFIGKTIKRQP